MFAFDCADKLQMWVFLSARFKLHVKCSAVFILDKMNRLVVVNYVSYQAGDIVYMTVRPFLSTQLF